MRFLFLALCLLAFSGCKDADQAQWNALGKRHRVTLYSANGNVIYQWIATGNVSSEHQSDGWYFEDEKTHLLVEVTGTLVIEVIEAGAPTASRGVTNYSTLTNLTVTIWKP